MLAHVLEKKTWKNADSADKCPDSYMQSNSSLSSFVSLLGGLF